MLGNENHVMWVCTCCLFRFGSVCPSTCRLASFSWSLFDFQTVNHSSFLGNCSTHKLRKARSSIIYLFCLVKTGLVNRADFTMNLERFELPIEYGAKKNTLRISVKG